MSGTSLDGVDGALVDFSAFSLKVLAFASLPMPPDLRATLLELNRSGPDELHRAAIAGNALVRLYARVVEHLLSQSGCDRSSVRAVGAHGQTVRHRPGEFDGTGYTLQLNQPALLAELCGMDVVADFRSRDVAAGGQGAPLVPPFHQALFGRTGEAVAVLNIGGISNITVLDAASECPVLGFDCGPGNALMDAWCLEHTGAAYDQNGQWAATGQVSAELIRGLLNEPYFSRSAPKSTGRDLFHLLWLQQKLRQCPGISAEDVQATLAELTARCCADSLRSTSPGCQQLLVCGGGALNGHLMARLRALLPGVTVADTGTCGLPPLQVEAVAFAWLAQQMVLGQPASLPKVTGARGARVLGAIYPA